MKIEKSVKTTASHLKGAPRSTNFIKNLQYLIPIKWEAN